MCWSSGHQSRMAMPTETVLLLDHASPVTASQIRTWSQDPMLSHVLWLVQVGWPVGWEEKGCGSVVVMFLTELVLFHFVPTDWDRANGMSLQLPSE